MCESGESGEQHKTIYEIFLFCGWVYIYNDNNAIIIVLR